MSVKGTFVGDMTLKICFIVGEEYANHCGVKDYAIRLADALERMGATVNVCAAPTWGAKDSLSFCHRLRATNYDIVHIQYPSIGYRSSLWPHILGCFTAKKRTVVTVHEYSALRSVQRLSTHIFRWTTSQLLFTTEFEAGRFRNSIGARDQVQKVVPIGSNVPTYSLELERAPNVIYFGQIRPERGIEEFLSLARLCLALSRPFKFMVVGSAPKKHADYSQRLRAQAPSGVDG
jgi:glycosyltransferase involved in cell wall biosynthesis